MPAASPVTPDYLDLQHVLESVFVGTGSVAAPRFGLGVTPSARRANVPDITTTATGAQIAAAVNAILDTLEAFGFHASV